MSSPFKTKEFLELNKKWQKKLKKSGFEDIEQDENSLKSWSMIFLLNYEPITWKAKEDYYRLAAQMLQDYKFSSKTEKFIWEEHAKGTSIRSIVKLLKRKGIKTYKCKVHATIKNLVKEIIAKCQK